MGVSEKFVINFQLAGGVWILQTLPATLLALYIPWLDRRAITAGRAAGIGWGTYQLMQEDFGSAMARLLGWKTSNLISARDYEEPVAQPENP